jgi:hypothetical protein
LSARDLSPGAWIRQVCELRGNVHHVSPRLRDEMRSKFTCTICGNPISGRVRIETSSRLLRPLRS